MTARARTDILLLAGFCTFLFFYGIAQFGLIGADEPRYAQVAREMLERGDWVTPTLGGRAWLEKPPLYYWQAMLAYRVLGISDAAARIPSSIDATLMVIGVYLFFRKFRPGVEVDASLISASCAGIIGYARAASMDMALTATFAMAMLAWWSWRERARPIYLAGFYGCIALGMLAKGPVAPFLAAAVIVCYSMVVGERNLIARTLWAPGMLLFLAVGLPWYIAVEVRNPQFLREFILEHNLARFSTNLYHHPEPFWYYIPVLLLALVPWIVFSVLVVDRARRVLFHLSIQASRLHPPRGASGSDFVGGLPAPTTGEATPPAEVDGNRACPGGMCSDRPGCADRLHRRRAADVWQPPILDCTRSRAAAVDRRCSYPDRPPALAPLRHPDSGGAGCGRGA